MGAFVEMKQENQELKAQIETLQKKLNQGTPLPPISTPATDTLSGRRLPTQSNPITISSPPTKQSIVPPSSPPPPTPPPPIPTVDLSQTEKVDESSLPPEKVAETAPLEPSLPII